MSMIEAVSRRPGFFSLDFGLGNLMAALAERRRRRQVFERVYSEMATMTDRELADLKMSRADFYYLAKQEADAS